MSTPSDTKSWDAVRYDRNFRFVTTYGQVVLDELAPQPGEKVLDLGCGTGELSARIASLGAEVVGIDRDPAMIERARERHPELRFECIEAHHFARPGGVHAFHAVFSNAALHWMLRPDEVIAKVRAALCPGGRFVAEFGGKGNVARIEQTLREARAEADAPARPSPWFFPSIATYARLLDDGGLEPRTMQLFDRSIMVEGDSGLSDWITMFATPYLDDLSSAQRAHILDRTISRLRPVLFVDGRWVIEYRRLRFVAVRSALE
jgi:trans-aconitate methyltransferase